MEERYGREIDLGLLWNIRNPIMQAVRKVHDIVHTDFTYVFGTVLAPATLNRGHLPHQVHHELAGLLSNRNRLAAHMAPPSLPAARAADGPRSVEASLPLAPPMLRDAFSCDRCPLAATCAIHHKVWRLVHMLVLGHVVD